MEPQGLRGTALVLAALAWLGLAGSEQASHFTTPVPPFPEALTAANREGKPLLLVFSASWCKRCTSPVLE